MSVVRPEYAVEVKIYGPQASAPGKTLYSGVSDKNVQATETRLSAELPPIPENSGGTSSMDSQESGCAICCALKMGQEPIARWPKGCSARLVPDPF